MKDCEIARAFDRDGFVILPSFLSGPDRAALKQRAAEIVDDFDAEGHRAIFSTGDAEATFNDYLLSSADKVACFFEEEAFDASGRLRQEKALSINKIAHALHDLDPVFDKASRDPRLAEIAAALGCAEPLLWQSMYIFKQPRIGGVVDWHQDGAFFFTEPESVITFWFALDDADRDNGCLWVEPGGHKGPLRNRFIRRGNMTEMVDRDPAPWPTLKDAKPVEVEAGALVVFHGRLPHYSAPNRSDRARHAYTLHMTDGAAQYAQENWLQRGESLPVRGF